MALFNKEFKGLSYSDNGSLLIFTLVVMTVLLLMGSAFIYMTQEERIAYSRAARRSEAFYAADAGVARGAAWILNVSPNPEWYMHENHDADLTDTLWEPIIDERDGSPHQGENIHFMPGSDVPFSIWIEPGPFPAGPDDIVTNVGSPTKYYTVISSAIHPRSSAVFHVSSKISQEVILHSKRVPSTGQRGDSPFPPEWPILRGLPDSTGIFPDVSDGVVFVVDAGLAWPDDWEINQGVSGHYDGLGIYATSWTLPNLRLAEDAFNEYESVGFGGLDNWKIPTVKELFSLIDFEYKTDSFGDEEGEPPFVLGRAQDYSEIGSDMIKNVQSDTYWTRTPAGPEYYYGVSFEDREIKILHEGSANFLIPAAVLREEFAVDRFYEDDPAGSVIAHPEHTEIIVDERTGLMWLADVTESGNFQDALDYAYELEVGDYNDWRIPDIKELHSIVDYGKYPDPLFYTGMTGAAERYWSTTYTDDFHTWCMDFSNGTNVIEHRLESDIYFLPVRGPSIEKRNWKEHN